MFVLGLLLGRRTGALKSVAAVSGRGCGPCVVLSYRVIKFRLCGLERSTFNVTKG